MAAEGLSDCAKTVRTLDFRLRARGDGGCTKFLPVSALGAQLCDADHWPLHGYTPTPSIITLYITMHVHTHSPLTISASAL